MFLPLVLITNSLLRLILRNDIYKQNRIKNIFLLFYSLVFYAWGGIYYLAIMISSIILNFIGGKILGKNKNKGILCIFVLLNLAILFYFKYFNMIIAIIENILAKSSFAEILLLKRTGLLNVKDIILPIGISFFTFQSMSYIIDVYRGNAETQNNIFDFGLYVSLFPQLIAGPIVKYSDIEKQLTSRTQNIELTYSGITRFCYGLAKKVLIANTLAEVADYIWNLNLTSIGSSIAWLGAIAYSFQIYYDFSGYSDMAIGIGRILGFEFAENFNYPYMATSVTDFWRRWHISLTSWFREYVYIPLGGNRKSSFATYRNILIVFLLTGIWHGANFTFIIWGLYFAIIQVLERAFCKEWFEKNPMINWAYTMFAIIIGWIIFRSNNINDAWIYIKQLFAGNNRAEYTIETLLSTKIIITLVCAFIFSGFAQRIFKKNKDSQNPIILFAETIIVCILFALSVMSLVSGTYNPFIYFQF